MVNIIEELLKEIEARGLNIARFSAETGIPADRVYQWTRGRGKPKGEDLVKIQAWMHPEEATAEKILAHDAILVVLLDEVAALRAERTGESVTAIRMRLQKSAEDVLGQRKDS